MNNTCCLLKLTHNSYQRKKNRAIHALTRANLCLLYSQAAVDTIIAKSGKIDILMNNAGIGVLGPVAEAPLDAYRKVWETNVGGVISVSQAVFPHMADRGSGMIINVSSLAGRTPL